MGSTIVIFLVVSLQHVVNVYFLRYEVRKLVFSNSIHLLNDPQFILIAFQGADDYIDGHKGII